MTPTSRKIGPDLALLFVFVPGRHEAFITGPERARDTSRAYLNVKFAGTIEGEFPRTFTAAKDGPSQASIRDFMVSTIVAPRGPIVGPAAQKTNAAGFVKIYYPPFPPPPPLALFVSPDGWKRFRERNAPREKRSRGGTTLEIYGDLRLLN